ncbi:MAG: AMP-binding protein [Pseudomonadota bacterium]
MGNAQTVGAVARQNAERFGTRTAFVDAYRSVSFEDFAARSEGLQVGLRRLGLAPGQRVAILSKNRVEYLECFMAADAGLTVVPLNWRLTPDELSYVLSDSRPTVLIAEADFIAAIGPVADKVSSIHHRLAIAETPPEGWTSYETVTLGGAGKGQLPDTPDSCDAACIVYTSGTTGRPKGAVLSHTALLASSRRIAQEMLALGPEDVTLAVMPLFHVGGMWFHCYPSFQSGACTYLQSAFRPDEALAVICDHGITNVHMAPTMVADILDRPNTQAAAKTLKTIFYAASPMPSEVLKNAMQAFPTTAFVQSYGSTEAGPICWLSPEDHVAGGAPIGGCGKPFIDVDITLRDFEGNPAAPEAVGEIHVKSASILTEYWDKPEATADTKDEGWIATGDLGRRDEDGYYFIVDRKNNMIISGGENIYPAEVEDVLHSIPGVVQAAVIGVPDDRWVERVVACIVKSPDADIDEHGVVAGAKARLSSYKCPKEVHFLRQLPRNAAGKILKKPLAEAYPFTDTS